MKAHHLNPVLQFPELQSIPWLVHGFIARQPDIDTHAEREVSLERLNIRHQILLAEKYRIDWAKMWRAEQIHGSGIKIVDASQSPSLVLGVDGILTREPGVPLGIYVADCCAIYLVDTKERAIGLLHSGKKGTEANIVQNAMENMRRSFSTQSDSLLSFLSPCIHSCCYEVDFVSEIERQLQTQGVSKVIRSPECTGCHLNRHYSYRKEKGLTGRMLAFLMVHPYA